MKLTPEDVYAWRETGYEPHFSAIAPGDCQYESPAPGLWGVMDAECAFVAFCRTEADARTIAKALDLYDYATNCVDLPEHHA